MNNGAAGEIKAAGKLVPEQKCEGFAVLTIFLWNYFNC